jgi:uncharacterized protein (DUF362 family)
VLGAARAEAPRRWAAQPPAGFLRLSLPGKVVKVTRPGCLQPNGVYPQASAANAMLTRAMQALTGKSSLAEAFATLVHRDDTVAIKPNGIAGRKSLKMASSVELVSEIVKAVMAVGVPADRITIFEQFRDFLFATRCVTDKERLTPAAELPAGVKLAVHLNRDAVMDQIVVGGIGTKFVRPFTEATAVINVGQVKDHAICGFTGAMKNITHGCSVNPQQYHDHHASPQIAHLFAQDVVKSRVVLHVADAYQVIYDEGPIDVNPKRRVPFETIYAATDPVALDVVGWQAVEKLRRDHGLPTLTEVGREPTYLRVAGELGLGVFDQARIRVFDVVG